MDPTTFRTTGNSSPFAKSVLEVLRCWTLRLLYTDSVSPIPDDLFLSNKYTYCGFEIFRKLRLCFSLIISNRLVSEAEKKKRRQQCCLSLTHPPARASWSSPQEGKSTTKTSQTRLRRKTIAWRHVQGSFACLLPTCGTRLKPRPHCQHIVQKAVRKQHCLRHAPSLYGGPVTLLTQETVCRYVRSIYEANMLRKFLRRVRG